MLRIVIAGHVDHGKSTLVGRLLHDTGNLAEGKKEELEQVCKRRGSELEWAFLLDAFQAERDQNITIDTTQVHLKTPRREVVIIDAPGHREFLKNMISGAAEADAAILVVDATEGIRDQTKRHARMFSLLGIKQVVVAVNKMDALNYRQDIFRTISSEIISCLQSIGIEAFHLVPLSARNGEMIVARGENMNWYRGPTLVEVIDLFRKPALPVEKPLRFAVQDVYRIDGKRVIAGLVESGVLRQGDEILVSPFNQRAKIESIESWPADANKIKAQAGEVAAITLGERIFIERGHIASNATAAPVLSHIFRADIFWLGQALEPGMTLKAAVGFQETTLTIQSIDEISEANDIAARMLFRARSLLALDEGSSRVILYEGAQIMGGGMISLEGCVDQRALIAPKAENIHRADHLLTPEMRAGLNGHKGGVFWLTGLSGAGKTTLAMQLEKTLFGRGYRVYVLDGDNVRHGLSADLGFSPRDRAENIRRVGQVAALMADAGLIVITAFISPYRADRALARASVASFHEIHVISDLATCERRDPKGLYKKARAGKITGFTGIDSPYEAPENPDLTVDTQHYGVGSCVGHVLKYIERETALTDDQMRKEKTFATA